VQAFPVLDDAFEAVAFCCIDQAGQASAAARLISPTRLDFVA
jgi:hypothetical protein